jgi:hypothetical protein
MKRMGLCNRGCGEGSRNTSACPQPLRPACLQRSRPATSETSAFSSRARNGRHPAGNGCFEYTFPVDQPGVIKVSAEALAQSK